MINIRRIGSKIGAYENGKLLGCTYGHTDTMILDVLGLPLDTPYNYFEYSLPEEYTDEYPADEADFDFIERFKI